MDLHSYVDILRRRKISIVAIALVLALAAFFWSSLKTPQYDATARVLLHLNTSDEQVNGSTQSINNPDRYVQAQIDVVQSATVATAASKDLGRSIDAEAVHARQVGQTDLIDITVRNGDPVTARDFANAVASAYIENRRQADIAGIQRAIDELDQQLGQLKLQIEALDRQIGDGGLDINGSSTLTPPSGSATAPTTPVTAPSTPASASSPGGLPTDSEALKAERYAAAVQYQSLFARRTELKINTQLKRGAAEFITEAVTPKEQSTPRPKRALAIGLVLGLMVGIAQAFVREQLDDRLRTSADMERVGGAPVLVELPADPRALRNPDEITATARPNGIVAERMRSLRTSLQFLSVEKPLQRLLVTSPGPGDGKSFVAANVATVFAQAGLDTIVVSADLRRPRLDHVFGVEGRESGLSELLVRLSRADGAGQVGPELVAFVRQVLVPTSVDRLMVLPAGPTPPNPAELLSSVLMGRVLDALESMADVVVIDTPPVTVVSDAQSLAQRVDGILVVVASGETRRDELAQTAALLATAKSRLLGLVLNKSERAGRGDAYYDSYRYGGYYDDRPADAART